MPRSRTLKPGFFRNEQLVGLGDRAMLLFAGLWTLADREGRLLDRPKLIKSEIFPYSDKPIERLLAGLEKEGFILRYSIAGEKFIQVQQFWKHQNPHPREAQSVIPAPSSVLPRQGNALAMPSTVQAGLLPLLPLVNKAIEHSNQEEDRSSPDSDSEEPRQPEPEATGGLIEYQATRDEEEERLAYQIEVVNKSTGRTGARDHPSAGAFRLIARFVPYGLILRSLGRMQDERHDRLGDGKPDAPADLVRYYLGVVKCICAEERVRSPFGRTAEEPSTA